MKIMINKKKPVNLKKFVSPMSPMSNQFQKEAEAGDAVVPFYWKHDLNLLLISLHQEHQDKFTNVRFKQKKVWEIIAYSMKTKMIGLGYSDFPTLKQCNGRWQTMMKQYKNAVDNNNKSGSGRKTCTYFSELDALQGDRPNVVPLAIASSSGLGDNTRKRPSNDIDDANDNDDDDDK